MLFTNNIVFIISSSKPVDFANR